MQAFSRRIWNRPSGHYTAMTQIMNHFLHYMESIMQIIWKSIFSFDRVSGQRDITLIANSHKLMNWSPLWFLSCVNVNQIHGLFFSPLCCRSRARMRHALHGLCVTPQNNLKICQVRMNPVTPIYKNFWDIWKQWNSECIERNYLRSRAECLIVTI